MEPALDGQGGRLRALDDPSNLEGVQSPAFTPTASSWVNQVERFFADVTEKQIRRGVHRSTVELETAIRAYLEAVNSNPKPFRWTKSADGILAAVKRFCLKTLDIASAQTEIARTSESH